MGLMMHKLKYSVYFIMLLLSTRCIYCSEEKKEEEKVFDINDQMFICSGWLSTIIYKFCENIYKIVKRDTSQMIEKMAPKDLQQDTARRRLLAEGPWRRVRRQVANECCLRPCTVAEILAYCPDDAKVLQENPDLQ